MQSCHLRSAHELHWRHTGWMSKHSCPRVALSTITHTVVVRVFVCCAAAAAALVGSCCHQGHRSSLHCRLCKPEHHSDNTTISCRQRNTQNKLAKTQTDHASYCDSTSGFSSRSDGNSTFRDVFRFGAEIRVCRNGFVMICTPAAIEELLLLPLRCRLLCTGGCAVPGKQRTKKHSSLRLTTL